MGSPTTLVGEPLRRVSQGGPSWKPSEPALPTHRSVARYSSSWASVKFLRISVEQSTWMIRFAEARLQRQSPL